jgi:hypothetical protein
VLDFADEICVALSLSDFELWTVTPSGLVADAVTVRVFVVVRGASGFDPPEVFVPGSGLAGAVTLSVCVTAFEIFWLAF